MHAMNDSVDMRRFGGLSTAMKVTWITFGAGWLAIIGFPGLSGFWSKDAIIEAAFVGTGWRPWVFGGAALIGAGITAFYMSRLFFMTFQGSRRWTPDEHPHESPGLMTVPMTVLAVGSAFVGVAIGPTGVIKSWLEPAVGPEPQNAEAVLSYWPLFVITLALIAVGVFLAWRRYVAESVPEVAPRGSVATRAARRDLYQDDVNEALFMRPGQYLTRSLVFVDVRGVDGLVRGLAASVGGLAGRGRRWQTGFVRSYAMSMLAGVLVVAIGVLVVRI
jgi:NADH-quinone oxidoreductase subunit L